MQKSYAIKFPDINHTAHIRAGHLSSAKYQAEQHYIINYPYTKTEMKTVEVYNENGRLLATAFPPSEGQNYFQWFRKAS